MTEDRSQMTQQDQTPTQPDQPQQEIPKPRPKNLPKNSSSQELDRDSLKRVIEALIFASDKPISVRQIRDIVGDVDTRLIRTLINELKEECIKGQRSFEITEVAGGFQFSTSPVYGRWLKKLYKIKQSDYLTGPSLETVAIIAYRQPVTKAEIEFIRGVSVDGVISSLIQKGLIKITGRKEVIGRPFLYGTTNTFLQYFGLNSTEELPTLPEFKEADLDFKKEKKGNLIESNRNRTEEENKQEASNTIGGKEEDGKDKEPAQ